MTNGSFRGKPTKSHIIWSRETRNGATRKQFDHDHFEKWVTHCGFDFEQTTRVDHDRSDEPQTQYRCIFKWGRTEGETMELGEEEWSFGSQRTPRTFIEIDDEGRARVKGWEFETVMNITEMRHKGPELLIKTASGDKKRLNGRKFVTQPRKRQHDDA